MASIGLNVSRDGRHAGSLVRTLGATWQRIVAMPSHDLRVHFQNSRQAGLQILPTLARESFAGFGPVRESDGYPTEKTARAAVRQYKALYGEFVAACQVGNEPDLESTSSWTMSQDDLVQLGRWVRDEWPRPFALIGPGLASGHPEWLDGADLSWCDAIAFQPYLKDAPNPTDIEDLPDVDGLAREYARFGKPLIISEWGWWGDDEGRAAEEVRDMIAWAGQTDLIEVFFYFAVDDAMVAPFGLLDANGKPKPRAKAFTEEAKKAIHSLWPYVEPPPIVVQPEPEPAPAGPDPWAWWTPEQLASAAQCPLPAVRENWPRLVEQMHHAGIYGRMVALGMIGTIATESASTFRPVREAFYLGEPEPAESHRRTLRYYPYYGRGFIQNTWEDSYRELGPKIAALWGAGGWEPDFDLISNPDNLLNADFSAAAAAIFFRDKAGGALLLAARAGQWDQVRRYVLGGPDPEGTQRIARIANQLGTETPAVPPDPVDRRDELIAGYEIALRTLRDVTLPAIRVQMAESELRLDAAQSQLDEARRIVAQMVGNS